MTMGTREQLDRHEIRVLRLIGQTPSDTFSEVIAPWVMELILEVCAGGPPDRAIQAAWPRLLGIVRNELSSLRRTEVHYIDYGRQGPCPETPADLAEAQGNIEAIDRLLAGPPWRA